MRVFAKWYVWAALVTGGVQLTPSDASAEPSGTILCEAQGHISIQCGSLARAEAHLSTVADYIDIYIRNYGDCEARCDFHVDYEGGSQDYTGIWPGEYSPEIPGAENWMHMLCYCK